jgi:hypothetical protein
VKRIVFDLAGTNTRSKPVRHCEERSDEAIQFFL